MEIVNWKDEIKERIENYNQQIRNVTKTLNKVIGELKVSPYASVVTNTNVELIEENRPTWIVKIAGKTNHFTINEFETEIHPPLGHEGLPIKRSLEEAIQKAILDKFKWHVK